MLVSGLSIETAKLLRHVYSRKASPKSIYVITKTIKVITLSNPIKTISIKLINQLYDNRVTYFEHTYSYSGLLCINNGL
jgi:hypothetical protein